MQIKVGYWLTDLPAANTGNLVVLPGSHRHQVLNCYDTRESVPGERVVCVRAGAITVMHSLIWHRVEPNHSDSVRKNLFYAYCPSWITAGDRLQSSPEWLATLTREQRIIMRSYLHAYACAKPPASDFPLFLNRDTGSDRDEGVYPEHVDLPRRKRRTRGEQLPRDGRRRGESPARRSLHGRRGGQLGADPGRPALTPPPPNPPAAP